MSLDVPGCPWMSLDVPGCPWMSLDVPESLLGLPFEDEIPNPRASTSAALTRVARSAPARAAAAPRVFRVRAFRAGERAVAADHAAAVKSRAQQEVAAAAARLDPPDRSPREAVESLVGVVATALCVCEDFLLDLFDNHGLDLLEGVESC